MGIPDHLTCLLRDLYAGKKAIVRTGHGTTCPNWERMLYVVTLLIHLICRVIMGNAGLDKAQAGIKIAGRNINNLRYAHDTTLMAESKEELKSLLMKVKERVKKLA